MKKAEREHLARVAELGCVACYVQAGVWGTPGEIHHIRHGQGFGQRAGNYDVICLCEPGHHRNNDKEAGKVAIHGNTGCGAFEALYGTEEELLEITRNNL